MTDSIGKPQDQREGWELASLSGGDHLKRVTEMYREMGFEVYVEEVRPEDCAGCTECFKASGEPVFRVYKRRPVEGNPR